MNTKIFLSLLLALPMLLTSCKKELEPQVSYVTPKAPNDNAAATPAPAQVQQTNTTTAPANPNSGLNPAHGQPGHVCGIAVGAPLNSATANTTAQQPVAQMKQPVNSTIKMNPPTTKTATGMNPPHGQPGHRCDISVGAPLNSPASKITTQQQPTGETKQAATVTPVTTNMSTASADGTPAILKAPVETAPGMNPPHGQPGHVCSTPVGSPLPK